MGNAINVLILAPNVVLKLFAQNVTSDFTYLKNLVYHVRVIVIFVQMISFVYFVPNLTSLEMVLEVVYPELVQKANSLDLQDIAKLVT